MLNHLRSLAVRQLSDLDESVRLVVIHPNFTQQHLILAELFDKAGAYIRFEGDNLTQPALKQQLDDALQTQNISEGQTLDYVLLDECDRAEAFALDQTLPDIQKMFPAARIIILSRSIPHCILNNAETRQKTAFLPHDRNAMLWDYAQLEDSDQVLLEVRAFGEGHVLLNGRLVDNWDGVLPRSLFFYLVDRGMTTRNEIFETFWPNLTTREATNVFHVTKRKISEVLGIDLTTYWSGFYRISSNIKLSYDVVLFTEMVQNAAIMHEPEEIECQLERAIALYQGHFLQGVELEWARKRRQELNQDYSDALVSLAKAKEARQYVREALGLYLRAAANSRHREDLTHSIMQLYHKQGMPLDALDAYDRLTTELDTELGVKPGQRLQELAQSIRHQIH